MNQNNLWCKCWCEPCEKLQIKTWFVERQQMIQNGANNVLGNKEKNQ